MPDFFVHESAYIDKGASVGRGSSIWHFSHIMSGAELGEECTLGQNVFIQSNVKIGNHCKIQNNVSVYEGVILEDYVFCGPSIGRHALIGSGAVVTCDVPDYALMVGIPAKRVGWACECGEILPVFESDILCPRCNLKYHLEENGWLIHDVQK